MFFIDDPPTPQSPLLFHNSSPLKRKTYALNLQLTRMRRSRNQPAIFNQITSAHVPCKNHTYCLYLQQPRNNTSAQVSVHIQPTTNHCTSFHQRQQSKFPSKTNNAKFHQRPTIKVQSKPISHLLTCKFRSYSRISKVKFALYLLAKIHLYTIIILIPCP